MLQIMKLSITVNEMTSNYTLIVTYEVLFKLFTRELRNEPWGACEKCVIKNRRLCNVVNIKISYLVTRYFLFDKKPTYRVFSLVSGLSST